jgi:hypothetical protein
MRLKGFRVQGLGFRIQGLRFRVQGLEFRVKIAELRASTLLTQIPKPPILDPVLL